MKEQILYATKIGSTDYFAEVISTKPENFAAAKIWAAKNGFDRIEVKTIDLSKKPNFLNSLKK